MRIIRGLEQISKIKNPVVTIGSFDGVHKAHQKIFQRLNSIARQLDGESVVITFDPHPRQVIYPKDDTLQLITNTEEKLKLLEAQNIDVCLLIPFSVEFSQQAPKEYVEKFLIEKINPKYIIIGYDHRFGLNRTGDFSLLKEYENKGHFELRKIEKLELDEMAISSTKVRNFILEGSIQKANQLLDYSFELNGSVVSGEQIGRELGYPTANLQVDEKNKIIPADGVYASKILLGKTSHNGMLYIGTKPTLSESNSSLKFIEVNILDFDKDIYGEKISVQVLKRIRPDQKFDSAEELKLAIQSDEKNIREYFSKIEEKKLAENLKSRISILNYNGKKWFEQYLSTVFKSSSYPFVVSIIDNASTDSSIEYLNSFSEQVEITPLEKNFGFAEGYNIGLEDVTEKYVVLLNSDVRVTANWLDPILRLMEEDEGIAVVQPKVLSDRDNKYFEHAGAAGGFMDSLAYPFCRGRIFDTCEEDHGQYDDIREIFWASGAAMVVRKSVWDNLGGFDSSFFAHMEEIDFCWRVQRAGYKVYYQSESTVYHYGGGTLDYQNPRKVYLNFRNNLKMLLRNESFGALLWKFPSRLILDGIAGLKFLAEFNFSSFVSVIKAHFAVYGSIFSIISSRKRDSLKVNRNRIAKKKVNRYSGSIIWQYYVRGRKAFSQLK